MRRTSLVLAALLLTSLLVASPASAAGAAQRPATFSFRALLVQVSEAMRAVFGKEGPVVDPLGSAGASSDTGPVVDPWGGTVTTASTDEGPSIDPWGGVGH